MTILEIILIIFVLVLGAMVYFGYRFLAGLLQGYLDAWSAGGGTQRRRDK
jgi:hypothetical protein